MSGATTALNEPKTHTLQLQRFQQAESLYFITFSCHHRQPGRKLRSRFGTRKCELSDADASDASSTR
jgi:hypothetical protein